MHLPTIVLLFRWLLQFTELDHSSVYSNYTDLCSYTFTNDTETVFLIIILNLPCQTSDRL